LFVRTRTEDAADPRFRAFVGLIKEEKETTRKTAEDLLEGL